MNSLNRLFSDKRRTRRIKEALPPALLVRAHAALSWLYREPEMRLLPQLTARSKLAIDVGANRGVYAYALSYLCSRVIAFEPIPALCDALARSRLRNVEVHQVALSDKAGEAILRLPTIDGIELDTRASLGKLGGTVREIRVPTQRLDALDLGPVGFIKIDVEGHEEAVLEGAIGLLESQRPNLIVEIEQRQLDYDMTRTFDKLERLGYAGYFLHEQRLRSIAEFDVQRHQTAFLANIFDPRYINNFIFRPRSA